MNTRDASDSWTGQKKISCMCIMYIFGYGGMGTNLFEGFSITIFCVNASCLLCSVSWIVLRQTGAHIRNTGLKHWRPSQHPDVSDRKRRLRELQDHMGVPWRGIDLFSPVCVCVTGHLPALFPGVQKRLGQSWPRANLDHLATPSHLQRPSVQRFHAAVYIA